MQGTTSAPPTARTSGTSGRKALSAVLGVEFGKVLEIRDAEHLVADRLLMQAQALNLRADDADQLDAAEAFTVLAGEIG